MLNSILLQIVTAPMDSASAAVNAVANTMPTVAPPTQDSLTLFDLLMKGGPMMIPIGILLLMAIYIFYEISLSKTVEIDVISKGLYQKMVSSGSGLTVGILAFMFYYILQIMVDKRVNVMEKTSIEFLDILQEPNK